MGRRALLAGALLLLALGVAAGVGFGYVAPRLSGGDDPLVARVAGQPLRLSDVRRRVNALALGDQIDVRRELPRFAASVVQEELLFQYALSGTRRDAVKAEVVENLIEREVRGTIVIDPAAIESYYREHIDEIRGEHLRARQIRLADSERCRTLQPQLDSEQAFIRAVREHSRNEELADRDGDMGYLMRHFDLLGFESELFGLPLHQAHRFDADDGGCYLIWLSEYLDPPPPPLAEVRDTIRRILSREREVENLRALLERAAAEIDVERFALPEPAP